MVEWVTVFLLDVGPPLLGEWPRREEVLEGYFQVVPLLLMVVSNSGPKILLVSWEDSEDVDGQ